MPAHRGDNGGAKPGDLQGPRRLVGSLFQRQLSRETYHEESQALSFSLSFFNFSSLSLCLPCLAQLRKKSRNLGRDERATATLNINRVASASAPWKPLSAEKNAVELNRPLLI